MIGAHIKQRLAVNNVTPAFSATLQTLVDHDDILGRHNWGFVIPTVAAALQAPEASITPFATAWGLLNAALRRLDHVQDDDPHDDALPATVSTGAHYNVLFSYYLLATAFLDELDSRSIAPARLLRLRRLWTDCLLRVASGQQADLEAHLNMQDGRADLDRYQQIVQAKTGALFGLAFGGTAALLTDADATIATLFDVGNMFGMLVQYNDDLADGATQCNATLTLPRAYAAERMVHDVVVPDVGAFWHFVYMFYTRQVEQALAGYPAMMRSTIYQLFSSTFEHRQQHEAA